MPWARGTGSGYRVKRPKTGGFGSSSFPPAVHLSSFTFCFGRDFLDQSFQSSASESSSRSKYATLVNNVLKSPRIVIQRIGNEEKKTCGEKYIPLQFPWSVCCHTGTQLAVGGLFRGAYLAPQSPPSSAPPKGNSSQLTNCFGGFKPAMALKI